MLKVREIKALARENLLGRYATVILAGFASVIVTLASLVIAGGALAYACYKGGVIGNIAAVDMTEVVIGSVVFAFFLLLGILLCFFMSIGNRRLLLNLLRGRKFGISDIFYAFKQGSHPFRVIIVQLICTFLISLPGSGIRGLAGIGAFLSRNGRTVSMPVIAGLSAAALLLGLLALYLGAAFMLADLIIIDEPGTGIFGAIRKSMDLMKKKKLKAIWMINFSFLLWSLLMAVCPLAALWILPYITASRIVFYLAARDLLWQLPGSGYEKHAPIEMDPVTEQEPMDESSEPADDSAAAEETGTIETETIDTETIDTETIETIATTETEAIETITTDSLDTTETIETEMPEIQE